MVKIVLISCASKKISHKAKAKDLYISPLFKMNLKFAKTFNPKKIFVLSAKYFLVDLNEEIEPYNVTLNTMSSYDVKDWANNVINMLIKVSDLKNDEFIILAGEKYRKYLVPKIKNYIIPLKGFGIGKQLHYLKERIK